MKFNNYESDACQGYAPPRSWKGGGKLTPLLTSISVRFSIQFLHGDTPSAELAVWVSIVPAGTMQHPVLLGRDSWMRFVQETSTILPRQPSQPIFGALTLSVALTKGLTTFISDNRLTTDTFHLSTGNSSANSYIVRFLDVPGPSKIDLQPTSYTTSRSTVPGSWCLQRHQAGRLTRCILRNAHGPACLPLVNRKIGVNHIFGVLSFCLCLCLLHESWHLQLVL